MSAREFWTEAVLVGWRDLTPTVREFKLAYPETVTAAPGAHIKIEVLVNGLPDRRSYSVVDTDGETVTIAVKLLQDSRGGSRYMWSLRQGARVRVSSPTSDFAPTYGSEEYLLIAGGIGVTPIVSICRALVAEGARVRVAYCVRSSAERAYLDELEQILGEPISVYVAEHGELIDMAAEIARLAGDGQLYLCGPMGLMDAVRKQWEESGRPRTSLRYETFGSSGNYATRPFTVRVPRLDIEVEVPVNRSMLDVLNEAGATTLSNCRRGECGLCAVNVVCSDGVIDHRDVFFTSEQHAASESMCTCVSRVSGGTVTIEPAWRGDPDLGVPEVLG